MNTSIYTADFVSIHGQTDPGRSGKNNEDSWDRYSILVPDGNSAEGMQPAELIIVADGIGGARGGEVASSLAVQEIGRLMEAERTPKRSIEQRLDAAIVAANRVLYDRAAKDPDLQGMGTTILTVVITQKRRCYIAHAGDSRAYLVRGNRIHLLTQDHTRVQEMVDMGRLTLAEAKEHPNRHVVSRFVGINDNVPVDLNLLQYTERVEERPTKALYIDLQPGDTIVCCSDGLNDMLDDPDILDIVRRNGLQNGPSELVKAANAKGGDDNITAVIASVLGAGGVAVTPVAGVSTGGKFPWAAVLGTVAVLLILALGGYYVVNGGLPGSAVAGTDTDTTSITPTVDGIAVVSEPTVAISGGTVATEVMATATPAELTITDTAPANGTAPVATSTRLVPTVTNTPLPTDTPRPTNTRAAVAPTAAGGNTNNPPAATQPPSATNRPATATVGASTGRVPVGLVGPNNNESFAQGASIVFAWQGQSLNGGETYNLKIWKQSSPGTLERESFTTGISASVQGLNPEVYQWSVQIVGGNGLVPGTESGVRNFSVSGGGGGEPEEPTGPEPTTAPEPTQDTPQPTPPSLPSRTPSNDSRADSDTKSINLLGYQK